MLIGNLNTGRVDTDIILELVTLLYMYDVCFKFPPSPSLSFSSFPFHRDLVLEGLVVFVFQLSFQFVFGLISFPFTTPNPALFVLSSFPFMFVPSFSFNFEIFQVGVF